MRSKRPRFTLRLLRRPKELVGWIFKRPSKRQVKIDTSLRLLHEVMGLDRLHYGLWSGEPLTVEGLRSAQARYSETLLGWIPEGVHRILDVGAGVGTDALELTRRGYAVEGLSPDPYQRDQFIRRTGLPFHLARFQEFSSPETYDLILMSESAQYIWIEGIFDKAKELAPGGYLLVSDYFLTTNPGSSIVKRSHPLSEFKQRAQTAGFHLEREEDVTDAVLPTLELATSWRERYADPTFAIVNESIQRRHPLVHLAARPLFRRALRMGSEFRDEFSSEEFKRSKRYLLMLFHADA